MNYARVSARYAKSLLNLATEKGKLDTVYQDMVQIEKAVRESRDLGLLLKSPVVKTDKKQAILKAIFGSFDAITLTFIEILSRKKREAILFEIATSFIRQYKESKGILTVKLKSAVKLDEALRNKIISKVAAIDKKEVELVEQIDPELIGGFVLMVDDVQVDASIARKFREIRQEFSKNL
jgi:F-type H+-transporting ATPase subunit delta